MASASPAPRLTPDLAPDVAQPWTRARSLVEETAGQIAALGHRVEHAYTQARLTFVVEISGDDEQGSARQLEGLRVAARGSDHEYALAGLGASVMSTLGTLTGDPVPSAV